MLPDVERTEALARPLFRYAYVECRNADCCSKNLIKFLGPVHTENLEFVMKSHFGIECGECGARDTYTPHDCRSIDLPYLPPLEFNDLI
jgi:hypothetical protein